MPAYFFHLMGDEPPLIDVEGINLPDLEAARMSAVFEAREIMKAGLFEGCLPLHLRFDVTDHAGDKVLTIPFHQTVRMHWPAEPQVHRQQTDRTQVRTIAWPSFRWPPELARTAVALVGAAVVYKLTEGGAEISWSAAAYDFAAAVMVASLAWLRVSLLRY